MKGKEGYKTEEHELQVSLFRLSEQSTIDWETGGSHNRNLFFFLQFRKLGVQDQGAGRFVFQ